MARWPACSAERPTSATPSGRLSSRLPSLLRASSWEISFARTSAAGLRPDCATTRRRSSTVAIFVRSPAADTGTPEASRADESSVSINESKPRSTCSRDSGFTSCTSLWMTSAMTWVSQSVLSSLFFALSMAWAAFSRRFSSSTTRGRLTLRDEVRGRSASQKRITLMRR